MSSQSDSINFDELIAAFDDFPLTKKGVEYAVDLVKDGAHINGAGIKREVSELERLAAIRFIDDLTGRSKMDARFTFDPEKSERACTFMNLMPHVKGRWAAKRELMKADPWQVFAVANIFGWVDENGNRRFRQVYIKVPRKNGKSFLAAEIGNYMLAADGEYAAEVYCGATSEKQAWEVFGPARKMAAMSPEFTERFGITVMARSLVILDTGAKFEPLIGKPGDGSNPHCAIADELHEHKSDEFVATMITGMGAREQPLLLQTTTAGNDIASFCYDVEQEAISVLRGVFVDDRFFSVIFGIDDGDDWTTREALAKANPNIGVSVSVEFLEQQQDSAVRSAARQNAFKRKHLNIWVSAHASWMNMEVFSKRAIEFDAADVSDWRAVIPIDLASRVDMTATPIVFFKKDVDGKMRYRVKSRFYLPEETAGKEGNDHYAKWVAQGHLKTTDGDELDFAVIKADIEKDLAAFQVEEITYDPWRATQLAQEFQKDGAKVVEFRNTTQNLSPAMFELEAAIYSGRFEYDGNPVMEWMFSNVVAKIDARDNIHPNKQKPGNKIDGAVAVIMAVGRIMEIEGPQEEQPEPGLFFL